MVKYTSTIADLHLCMNVHMRVEMQLCAGHPNTPLFFGVLNISKSESVETLPALVMSLHTVNGSPFTMQALIHGKTIHERDCAFLLLGKP